MPAAFVAFITGRRLPTRMGGAVIGIAALLGGVIVAGTLEFDAQRDLGALPMVGVGLIEETSKLAVALHTLWDSQTTLIGLAVVAVVSLAVLGWTVHRVHRAADGLPVARGRVGRS